MAAPAPPQHLSHTNIGSAAEALASLNENQRHHVEELLLSQLQSRRRSRNLNMYMQGAREVYEQACPTLTRTMCFVVVLVLLLLIATMGYHYSTVLAYPLAALGTRSGYPALELTLKRYNFKNIHFRCPAFFPKVCLTDFVEAYKKADKCTPFGNCMSAHVMCLQLKRHCVYNQTATHGWAMGVKRPGSVNFEHFTGGLREQARYTTFLTEQQCKDCVQVVSANGKSQEYWWGDRVLYNTADCMECKYGSVEAAQLPVVQPPQTTVESLRFEYDSQSAACKSSGGKSGCDAWNVPEEELRFARALDDGNWPAFHQWAMASHFAANMEASKVMLLVGETKCAQLWGTPRYPVEDCCVDPGENKLVNMPVTTCTQNFINNEGACTFPDSWVCTAGLLCCERDFEGHVVVRNADVLNHHRKQAHSLLHKFGLRTVPKHLEDEEKVHDFNEQHKFFTDEEREEQMPTRGVDANDVEEYEHQQRLKAAMASAQVVASPPIHNSHMLRRYGALGVDAFKRSEERVKEYEDGKTISDEFKQANSLMTVVG